MKKIIFLFIVILNINIFAAQSYIRLSTSVDRFLEVNFTRLSEIQSEGNIKADSEISQERSQAALNVVNIVSRLNLRDLSPDFITNLFQAAININNPEAKKLFNWMLDYFYAHGVLTNTILNNLILFAFNNSDLNEFKTIVCYASELNGDLLNNIIKFFRINSESKKLMLKQLLKFGAKLSQEQELRNSPSNKIRTNVQIFNQIKNEICNQYKNRIESNKREVSQNKFFQKLPEELVDKIHECILPIEESQILENITYVRKSLGNTPDTSLPNEQMQ